MAITILSSVERDRMRRAGRAAAATLAYVGARLAPGMTTKEIDRLVRVHTEAQGGRPSQLGYHGFPAAVCVSVTTSCATACRARTSDWRSATS